MLFKIKRVFVAMICAVFICGFSMASTVFAQGAGHKKPERFLTVTFDLNTGKYTTDPPMYRLTKKPRHDLPKDELLQLPTNKDSLWFCIFECQSNFDPCDWVYYIPLPPDYVTVLEVKGNDPDCTP